jgi:hypothetical protein
MAVKETYAQLANIDVLTDAILADATITTTLEWIDVNEGGPTTDIFFSAALSGAEKTALDAIMASTPAPTVVGLLLTSDQPKDPDGVPATDADGVQTHVLTITKVNSKTSDREPKHSRWQPPRM